MTTIPPNSTVTPEEVERILARHITIVTMKGGPGSGHFEHAGVPGQLGGSAPDHAAVADFENSHYKDDREWGMGVNRDGHLVYTAMGSKNDLSIPWEAAVKLDGGTWTHVHPVNLPLSMEDVATAIHLNMAEIRAVANDNGNMVTYSIKPESGGKWPNRETFAWNVMGTRDELALHVGGPKDAYNYWNNFWKSLAPRVGLVYEVHS